MRILYLVSNNEFIAGGATVRDAVFVRGLVEAGHEVNAVSLYGPARIEGEKAYSAVFHSLGHNTLRRIFPRLSRIPNALATMVRKPRPVMNMTSLAVSGRGNDARGPMAVSLLAGSGKMQRREFSRLMEYLARKGGEKIDAVVLANTMLSGWAEPLMGYLSCPIVCLSQGSDRVIENLEEPYRSDARKLVRRNARLFRLVVTTSRYFAIRATESMALPPAKVKVVSPGVDVDAVTMAEPRRRDPFTIGFMGDIGPEKGLDILIDAVDGLVKDSRVDSMLWISGKVTDDRYWQRLRRRLDTAALRGRYKAFGELVGEERRKFMTGLSVFVVTSREPESRATHLMEAMAVGVPVVGPASGIIPEIFQEANGGLLVSSDAPAWMYGQALELLASMPDTADEMGRAGAKGVREHFSTRNAAVNLAAYIEEVTGKPQASSAEATGRYEKASSSTAIHRRANEAPMPEACKRVR